MDKRLSAWVRGILVVLLIRAINAHAQEVAPSQLDESARRAVVRGAAEELRQRSFLTWVTERPRRSKPRYRPDATMVHRTQKSLHEDSRSTWRG
jgi:hypothetical protein